MLTSMYAPEWSKTKIKKMSNKLIKDLGNIETEEIHLHNLCTIYENFSDPGIKSELRSMGYVFGEKYDKINPFSSGDEDDFVIVEIKEEGNL